MKVNIVDINRVIQINDLQEVTNPVFFNTGNIPTSDGLFSYEIFGRMGSDDRKNIFAYIDLKKKFLHPLAYKALSLLDRKILKLISGQSEFIYDEGTKTFREVKDNEDGNTGLEYFYSIYEKYIDSIKSTSSQDRKERIKFLKNTPKNAIFQDKLLVCPAYYRDVNFKDAGKGKINVEVINSLYAKIINLVNALKQNDIAFMNNVTMFNIQTTLNEISDRFLGVISGHNPETGKRSGHGLFHENVMGKSVDLGIRSVITSSTYNYKSYKDMKVDVWHTGVPLGQCCVLFFDFIMKGLTDFFENNLGYIQIINRSNEQPVYLKSARDEFSYENLKKQVYKFIKTPSERFETVKVQTENGLKEVYYRGKSHNLKDNTIGDRPLTWVDLLFIVASDVVKDKHVYITRYPVISYMCIYPSKITITSTFKVKTEIIDGIKYDNYPVIDLKMEKDKVANNFVDSLTIFNGYTTALGVTNWLPHISNNVSKPTELLVNSNAWLTTA